LFQTFSIAMVTPVSFAIGSAFLISTTERSKHWS